MSRRRSSIVNLLEGFQAGMQMAQAVRGGMKQRELAEAGSIVPTGQMAEASTEDVQAQIDSGAGMGEARNLASAGRQAPTAAETGAARRQAQLGVLEKYGDFEGANRLRAQDQALAIGAQQIEESKKRTAREDKVFARQEKAWSDEDAYKADRDAAFKRSTWATKLQAYFSADDAYKAAKSEYDAKVAAGDTTAVAPIQPEKPTFSPGESMLDRANALAVEIQHGKATDEQRMKFVEMQKQILDEGYIKGLRLLLSPDVPLTRVISQFNENGNIKIDPNSIITDKPVTRQDGTKTRIVTFKGPDGKTQTIDALAELDSLGKAGDIFERAVKAHSMRVQDQQLAISRGQLGVAQAAGARAAAAEQRAAEDHAAGAPERQLKGTLATLQMGLANTDDPGERKAIQAKLDAVRGGVGDKDKPSEVKLAAALRKADPTLSEKDALRMALSKKDESPDQIYRELVQAEVKQFGMPDTDDGRKKLYEKADVMMQSMGYRRKGGRWSASDGSEGEPAKLSNVTAADITATAKKYGISEDEVKQRLGLK